MSPLEFLHEELANVRRALDETLRYDYGPEQGREFYTECAERLAEIEKGLSSTRPSDLQTIRTRLNELQELSAWILLIERSHLGEFSWPFSDELKRIANRTFVRNRSERGPDSAPHTRGGGGRRLSNRLRVADGHGE